MAFKRRSDKLSPEEEQALIKEILSMATFDDLFGGKSSGQRFMKFEKEGESLLLEQTGEPKRVPQLGPNDKPTWLVKLVGAPKYKPMEEGDFDPDDESEVENAFQPEKEIVIPVRVVGKKNADGSKDEDFTPFDTDWEVTKGQKDKLKDAMLEASAPAEKGTKYVVKLLSRDKKPYTYAVRILDES